MSGQLNSEIIFNTLYGAIVADALGVPVEFTYRDVLKKNPVTGMRAYGTYNLPAGSWSDDSSMTLCLADSIRQVGGVDYNDIMRAFLEWFKHSKYTPDSKVFDVGQTCSSAIRNYDRGLSPLDCGLNNFFDNGNGSLMRISPLALYIFERFGELAMEKEEVFEIIHNVSRLTHSHSISLTGCDIYISLMIEILNGVPKEALQGAALPKITAYCQKHPKYEEARKKYQRIFNLNFKNTPEEEIMSNGYIVNTLEAALWCFLNTENYRDCVLKAVNLGEDTDTVACIAGSIAGLYYGDIPDEWKRCIRNKKLVEQIISGFAETIQSDIFN